MSASQAVSSLANSTATAAAAGYLSNSFCGYCGERLPASDDALRQCPFCSKAFRDVRPTMPVPLVKEAAHPAVALPTMGAPEHGSPVLAALLSTVVPGLGQVYNGQMFKGVFVFLTCWLVIPWLFGIFDAYVMAKRSH